MSNKFLVFILLILLVTLVGCSKIDPFYEDNGKLKFVTTLFPQYDFVKKIGKDKVDVKLLIKPGVESHSFEPTPTEIANISTKADAFIYTSDAMEPWANKIIDSIKNENLVVVEASNGVDFIESNHDEEEESHEEENVDPHVWLDPLNAIIMIDNILQAFIEVDPVNKDFYEANALNYKNEIINLDEDFQSLFNQIPEEERLIIHGGHFAFGYFAKRYDLNYISPYQGFSPNAEPTPTKITELVKLVRDTGQHYIYSEEMVEPRVANIISNETGAEILLLHGVHNISQTELESNESYVSIMRQNLENLKKGFGIK
ncbi:MAG: acdA [Haloplasmataceae bacterium]|jgi:zinc transport system substrate-binding protein|nr:acdA [Haloplasmataceae bacterium]